MVSYELHKPITYNSLSLSRSVSLTYSNKTGLTKFESFLVLRCIRKLHWEYRNTGIIFRISIWWSAVCLTGDSRFHTAPITIKIRTKRNIKGNPTCNVHLLSQMKTFKRRNNVGRPEVLKQ